MSAGQAEPRMFHHIDRTWNPVIGCLHNCSYCWARDLTETRLKGTPKYIDGFEPKLCECELEKRFNRRFVFVTDMGDLFGRWIPREWILRVLKAIQNSPSSNFLFLTKNPGRYREFLDVFPENLVLGATIETDRTYNVSDAPTPAERYKAMADIQYRNKLISIEPIMDFDLDTFVQWIKDIAPTVVYVGYDNYNNGLPEPPLHKTMQLVKQLETFTGVRTKTLREGNQGQ